MPNQVTEEGQLRTFAYFRCCQQLDIFWTYIFPSSGNLPMGSQWTAVRPLSTQYFNSSDKSILAVTFLPAMSPSWFLVYQTGSNSVQTLQFYLCFSYDMPHLRRMKCLHSFVKILSWCHQESNYAQPSNPSHCFSGGKNVSAKIPQPLIVCWMYSYQEESVVCVNKCKKWIISGTASLPQMRGDNGLETSGAFCKQAY